MVPCFGLPFACVFWGAKVSLYCFQSKLFVWLHVCIIAKPKGEASNRDALSSPVCINVCIYVYLSQLTRDT